MVIDDRTVWRQTFRARYRVGVQEKQRTLVYEWEGQRPALSPQAAISRVIEIEDVPQLLMLTLDIEIVGIRELSLDWRDGVMTCEVAK